MAATVLAGGKGSPLCSDGIDILSYGIKPTAARSQRHARGFTSLASSQRPTPCNVRDAARYPNSSSSPRHARTVITRVQPSHASSIKSTS